MRSRLQKVHEILQEEISQKQDFNAWMKKPERSGENEENSFREQLTKERR